MDFYVEHFRVPYPKYLEIQILPVHIVNNDLLHFYIQMIDTCYNISKFLFGKIDNFQWHPFNINEHVDGISEVSKKHDQYVQKNGFFSRRVYCWFTSEIIQCSWYCLS